MLERHVIGYNPEWRGRKGVLSSRGRPVPEGTAEKTEKEKMGFFYEVGSNLDPRTQAYWPIALFLSFKFIGSYSAVQPAYRGLPYWSASPLLFDPDPPRQSPKSASISIPAPGIHIECVPTFLHHISRMRESVLSSSWAACNAD